MSSVKNYIRVSIRLIFNVFDLFFHFLFKLIYRKSTKKVPPISDLLLLDSATKIAFKIRTRKLKCTEVLESYIKRINQINPVTNCMVSERFEEAREEARKYDELLDSELMTEEVLIREKPLLGVPFTTKDCIAVKGMIQTAGLVARKDILAPEDAYCIKLLRNAGAIPIALTNISELAMWWESANNVHGRTNNPYDITRTVGGSSGGEGCLQASAGSAFGVGSDIGGSIRMPSFFNGIFGHKPSPYVVSNDGQYPVPVSKEQGYYLGIGPMCRHSEDLLPILKVMAGVENALKFKLDAPVHVKDLDIYYQEDDQGSLAVSPVNREIRTLFRKLETYFERAHAKKLKKLELKKFAQSTQIWLAGMKLKNGPRFEEQLTNLTGTISVPLELFKWCFRRSNHTFIALGTAFLENFGMKYGDVEHTNALNVRDELRTELIEILGENGVLIYPTHPTVAPYHNEPVFKPFNFSYTGVVNMLGLPATHVPLGLNSEGLPLGLQIISAPNNDRFCLAIARDLEKAFGGWVPPQME